MKAYKATYNLTCQNFKFEVGQAYEIQGELKICNNGFHFCKKMEDVLIYYSPQLDFILLEVEPLGDVIDDENKSVTNKIKIIRIIPQEEHKLFDIDGRTIHCKNSNGDEWWDGFDERSNLIYHKNSDGDEWWREFDGRNNCIHFKDSNGYEYWKEFDGKDNLIDCKDSIRYEYWQNYIKTTY